MLPSILRNRDDGSGALRQTRGQEPRTNDAPMQPHLPTYRWLPKEALNKGP
jgi:hypothetical protein